MSAVPVTRPRSSTRTRTKVRIRPRRAISQSQTLLTAHVTTFIAIVGVTFIVSSLSGQVMVEKARKEGFMAMTRAVDARKNEANLRHRLDSLTSLTSVDEWAKTHAFIAPDQPVANGALGVLADAPGAADKVQATAETGHKTAHKPKRAGMHNLPSNQNEAGGPPAANQGVVAEGQGLAETKPKKRHHSKKKKVLDNALAQTQDQVNGDAQQD